MKTYYEVIQDRDELFELLRRFSAVTEVIVYRAGKCHYQVVITAETKN